jgi:hypothetical protein
MRIKKQELFDFLNPQSTFRNEKSRRIKTPGGSQPLLKGLRNFLASLEFGWPFLQKGCDALFEIPCLS